MNSHMATLPRVIQNLIAQPRFSEMNSTAGNQRRTFVNPRRPQRAVINNGFRPIILSPFNTREVIHEK